MSHLDHSDTASSVLTSTASSTSTIPGLGATSGKALKRVGSVVVNGVDAILVRRRISRLESIFRQKHAWQPGDFDPLEADYNDLLELSRSVYDQSIRNRAFRVIMGIIRGTEFEDLALAVSEWHLTESYDLLKEIILCFQLRDSPNRRLASSYTQRHNANTSEEPSLSNGLRFMALVISFSQTPRFSRLAIHELNLIAFITETCPDILKSSSNSELDDLLSAKLVFCALVEKLDPIVDGSLVAELEGLLATAALNCIPLSSDNLRASILPGRVNTPFGKADKKALHRQAEKELSEHKAKLALQVKVLLIGSGSSGKSTFLKQLRLLHRIPFSAQEIESFRQLVFENLTHGMRHILDAMEDMELEVSKDNISYVDLIDDAPNIREGEAFPQTFLAPLISLWADSNVQHAYKRGNEAALPENLNYYFSQIDRLFQPSYQPTEEDIIHLRYRTIGITETTFNLRDHEMIIVDVGGQKSERRKWIHCFQNVTSIIFLASLAGYDQCLVEDRDANQMQDALTIWDSICHSQWFKRTSIVLLLTKNDLFAKKIPNSDIKGFFPDYDGRPGDAKAGREYFKKRFGKLARKADKTKEREIYIHTMDTMTETSSAFKVILAAVEE